MMETLSNGQVISTVSGRHYVLTATAAVKVVDGTDDSVELVSSEGGQVSFLATSGSIKLVIAPQRPGVTVKGSLNEAFKSAPALGGKGGGLDVVPQDGGVYGVTYVNGAYQGIAVERKPLIDKTVYDDISQMTQVLPPGTYDFEMEKLAIAESTGGTIWHDFCYVVYRDQTDTKHRISASTLPSNVDFISAQGNEYIMNSGDNSAMWRSPLRVDSDGLYMQFKPNQVLGSWYSVRMSNTVVRLTIKNNCTLNFYQLILQMFAFAIDTNYSEKLQCVPHVIKVYPV